MKFFGVLAVGLTSMVMAEEKKGPLVTDKVFYKEFYAEFSRQCD